MNRIIQTTWLVTMSAALSLTWMGCSKSAPKITAGPPPTTAVELKLKWPVGARVLQSVDLKQTIDITIPGSPNPVKQEMNMTQTYARNVLRDLPDGGHEVELEFVGTKMSSSGGNQPALSFDTSDKSDTKNPLAATFQKLVGAKVRLFLDANSEPQRIEGMEDFKKRLGINPKDDPMGILKNLASEEMFRNLMRGNRNLPDHPVQPGDTWPVQQEIVMGTLGTMVTDYTYTFKSWERHNEHNCAHIEFAGTLKSKPGQDLKVQGMTLSIDDTKSAGETWFDLEEGMFVETTMNQDMKMTIAMPQQARTRPGTPQTIAMVLNQDIVVKLNRVK